MSTLNEKISAIVEKSAPISVKFFELVNECQLTQNDAANVLGLPYRQMLSIRRAQMSERAATHRAQRPAPQINPLDLYTFGVEIECKTRLQHGELLTAFQNAEITSHDDYEHYNHNDSANSFKIMRDGSVNNIYGRNTYYGNEVVSPVLKNFDTLQKVCKVLNETGAKVDIECGLHVHIGAAELTDYQYVSVFENYKYLQFAINKFMPQSRRDNFYAKPLTANFAYCENKEQVKAKCRNSRYFVVNPLSYERHKTIEFRQHSGSTSFTKIKNWVNFCKKLVEFSKTNRLDRMISEISEIPFLSDSEKAYFERRAEQLA